MRGTVFAAALAAMLAAPIASPARADRADDDLAAVRKAVGGAAAPARPVATEEEKGARPGIKEGKWLRVRVVERAGQHGKVSINLPLGLARAFGEDWPIRGCSRRDEGRRVTLGEVLRALDSGQSLVEIDDDEASVRVWVE